MTSARIVETDEGIQGEFDVILFDQMQRRLRDKGWIETKDIMKRGIDTGCALEVGSGPGYLGLEWLKHTEGTSLKGLDMSMNMIKIAMKNAQEYGLTHRVEYIHGNGDDMPFDADIFDAVFTNGSLHEWVDPRTTFNEIWRVTKEGGRIFISDLRRDMSALVRFFLWLNTMPKEMRLGLASSINASYTRAELERLVKGTPIEDCTVTGNLLGVILFAIKRGD